MVWIADFDLKPKENRDVWLDTPRSASLQKTAKPWNNPIFVALEPGEGQNRKNRGNAWDAGSQRKRPGHAFRRYLLPKRFCCSGRYRISRPNDDIWPFTRTLDLLSLPGLPSSFRDEADVVLRRSSSAITLKGGGQSPGRCFRRKRVRLYRRQAFRSIFSRPRIPPPNRAASLLGGIKISGGKENPSCAIVEKVCSKLEDKRIALRSVIQSVS